MGHIPLESYESVYKALLAKCRPPSKQNSVLVFVAPDTDSLCACRILLNLLKSDCISYQVLPVSGYADLAEANEHHIQQNEQLAAIIMLNAGGTIDLLEFLQPREDLTVYVLDSHRPLNLHNLFVHDKIVVLDDGDVEDLTDIRAAFEDLELNAGDSEEDSEDGDSEDELNGASDDSVDGDAEEDEDEEAAIKDTESDDEEEKSSASKSKKKKTVKQVGEDSDAEGEEEEDEEAESLQDGGESDEDSDRTLSPVPSSRKKKRRKLDEVREERAPDRGRDLAERAIERLRKNERRKRLQEEEETVQEYYQSGSFYGMSVANMMYNMATQLGRSSNDFLWLAIIGLTDQYIHQRINYQKYLLQSEILKEEVSRFNIPSGRERDPLLDTEALFGDDLNPSRRNNTNRVKGADDSSIICDEDFRLSLLRHWSLQESMYHSSYVAARLGIWREKGRRRLTNLLVKMGYPQKECQQHYKEMSLSYKQTLKEKLGVIAPKYSMMELMFPSFYRHYGYKATLSASDIVYSIGALLDAGAEWVSKHGTKHERVGLNKTLDENVGRGMAGVGAGTRTGFAAVDMHVLESLSTFKSSTVDKVSKDTLDPEADSEESLAAKKDRDQEWIVNFYVAYDALDNIDLLNQGIHLSIHFQKSLVAMGVSVIEKKLVSTLNHFQLAVLKGEGWGLSRLGSTDSIAINFGQSTIHLSRLAAFLMDAFLEHRKKDLPLIIAALDEESDSFLVIGMAGKNKHGSLRKNTFGLVFQDAAEKTRARMKHDSFESSVVQVRREDISEFLEHIQTHS